MRRRTAREHGVEWELSRISPRLGEPNDAAAAIDAVEKERD
jgi:hypothetical protein